MSVKCAMFSEEKQSSTLTYTPKFNGIIHLMFTAIFLVKTELSEAKQDLQQLSFHWNTIPETRNLSKYICKHCKSPFPISYPFNRHMNHKHNETLDIKADLTCQYCVLQGMMKENNDENYDELDIIQQIMNETTSHIDNDEVRQQHRSLA
ncbi:uncharacterized protein TRUGW13939_05399 [Talaromyces rugulosus]|uniref:C2H2-type domain-containing protein n=1 Tax=Talaromyces rugulosus TaxID=121627 RepID=A0A7H8QWC6_TALRU|nr:uncharacterized protein TRUGW13939_05399 [Talaromyces rugulosus]QKX58277.1 hypothetical protein TRUGW13939_05399 [Talaromyces rugulosus]